MKKLSEIVEEINSIEHFELKQIRLDQLNRWLGTEYRIVNDRVKYFISGVDVDLFISLNCMGL